MEFSLCIEHQQRAPLFPKYRRACKNNARDCSMVRNVGVHHQLGEVRESCQTSDHASRIDMKYEPDECLLGTGEEDELVCNVQEMGKDRYVKRASENEALCGISWMNQFIQIYCERHHNAHEYAFRIPNQGSQEGGVGWIIPTQSQGL